MKKWGVIFLLFGLLFNTTGYYFSFILSSLSAHADVWLHKYNKEDESDLVYLNLNSSELSGVNFVNESEFVYQGSMYDLVESTDSAGVSTFKCYSDKKETQAVAELDKEIKSGQNQAQDNHKPSPLKELFKYYLDSSKSVAIALPKSYTGFYPTNNTWCAPALLHSVISPPPDIYCC